MSQPSTDHAPASRPPRRAPRIDPRLHEQPARAASSHDDQAVEAAAHGTTGAAAPQRELPAVLMTGLALMCTLLWAAAQIGVKYGLEVCPPFALMGMRFVAASVILLPAIAYGNSPWPQDRAAWLRTLGLGVLNNTLYLGLTALGLAYISAGLACVLTGLNPLALAIGGALFFRERVTGRAMLGLVGAMAGVAFVMAGRLGSDNTLGGVLIIVAANATMVAGNLLYKRWQGDCGLLVSHSVQLFVGGVTLLLLSVLTEPWAGIEFGARLFWAEAFLVFGVSFGAMVTWLFLLGRGSASKAGAFLFLVPLFGLAESAIVLGETLSPRDLWGAAATTMFIWYAQRSSKATSEA